MDHNDSRLMLIICAGMFAFLTGIVGLAFVSDEVRERVDRRVARQVDQRLCQVVENIPCPPPVFSGGGD